MKLSLVEKIWQKYLIENRNQHNHFLNLSTYFELLREKLQSSKDRSNFDLNTDCVSSKSIEDAVEINFPVDENLRKLLQFIFTFPKENKTPINLG